MEKIKAKVSYVYLHCIIHITCNLCILYNIIHLISSLKEIPVNIPVNILPGVISHSTAMRTSISCSSQYMMVKEL